MRIMKHQGLHTTASVPVESPFTNPMKIALTLALAFLTFLLVPGPIQAQDTSFQKDVIPTTAAAKYVIHISVDGLRPDAITHHDADELPNFYRLRKESAFTDRAHTDIDYSNTLPNHIAQLTGRPVLGSDGHHWTSNTDPEPGETIHSRRGNYVASAFDVAHDNGLRTGVYASKSKFVLFDRSYNDENGAPDVTGVDNGRDKIDHFVLHEDTEILVDRFVRDMGDNPYQYAFIHLRNPDSKGHTWGWRLWKWHPYMRAVRRVDKRLGQIFEMIESDPRFAGNTMVVLTSDHGGSGHSHGAGDREHYTIPFYVWGPGIPAGNLYALNSAIRQEPDTGRPGFGAALQPIRNGGAGNLALSLLGLEPVPGSSINATTRMQVLPAARLAVDDTAKDQSPSTTSAPEIASSATQQPDSTSTTALDE